MSTLGCRPTTGCMIIIGCCWIIIGCCLIIMPGEAITEGGWWIIAGEVGTVPYGFDIADCGYIIPGEAATDGGCWIIMGEAVTVA